MLAVNKKRAQKNRLLFCFLVIPTILMAVFMLLPLAKLIGLSFTDWNGLSDTKNFVGLSNYKTVFFNSPEVWSALKNNGVYFIFHLLFIPVELFIAFLLDNKVRGCKTFKTIVFLPYIINGVAVACMFSFLYSSENGVLNSFLQLLNMNPVSWLSDPNIVNKSLAVVSIWKFAGIHIILFLAAFQSLPTDMLEASHIDGASTFKQFYHIVLPNIRGVVEIILFLNVRGALMVFDIPYVMTSGGPGNASSTFTIETIRTAFQYSNFGKASAMAVVLMMIIIVISLVQKGLLKSKEA